MGIVLKWNLKAFDELRTHPKVRAEVNRRAEAIANAAGDGYEVLPEQTPRKRARRLVAPVTGEAKRDNEKNNTLLRAIDAGR